MAVCNGALAVDFDINQPAEKSSAGDTKRRFWPARLVIAKPTLCVLRVIRLSTKSEIDNAL
jgi:hypothetical protein